MLFYGFELIYLPRCGFEMLWFNLSLLYYLYPMSLSTFLEYTSTVTFSF